MSEYKKWKCKSTALLPPEENEEITNMLKHKSRSIETTIIQLYSTAPPNHSEWIYNDCGVLCFIQDAKRKCYFFQLYCLVRKRMVWEHKVQKDIDYTCLKTFLGSFQGDECVFAFNFACKSEANTFNACVLKTIAAGCKIIPHRERKVKAKLSKKDISVPIGPQHTFHVGFKNMDVLKLSPADIESFFEKKNINKKVLQAKPTVVASSVTPISIFHSDNQQNVIGKPKLKSSGTFSTFQDFQQNLTSNSNGLNRLHKFPEGALSSPKLANKSRPIPPPKPLQRPSNLSHSLHDLQIRKRNVSPALTSDCNKNFASQDDMSIDNSLAVLSEISDFLNNIDDETLKVSSQEHHSLIAQDQKLKEILERRIQFTQSDSDSASDSDNDDDWDD